MTDKELVERYRMALEAIIVVLATGYSSTNGSNAYYLAKKALEQK